MGKKKILQIIEWAVAIAALVYLVWRLATYDDYAALWESLRGMGWPQWLALVICIALMPVNMTLEAWRWRTLISMSWREAHRQVYYSKLAGLITPWRLGEYPARALLMGEGSMKKVLSMGAVGSATMTIAIVGVGLVSLAFSPTVLGLLGDSYLYAVAGVTLVMAVGLYYSPQWLKKYAEMNGHLLLKSLVQSVVRLGCWCVQLALVLWALGAFNLQPATFCLLPVYYLLVTITPNVPVVEAGVRGAWAMLLFGTANAALAGVLLWAINTLLPCLSWVFMKKTPQNK